jgi:hypothetical protein
MLAIGLLVLVTAAVAAEVFPNKSIRIVTGGVGGGGDMRLV